MRVSTKVLLVAALLAAAAAPATYAKTAAELLREGLYVEEVEGDLDKAIGIYQQVIADPSAPKNLVAQALYRQGSVYLKKKQEPEAHAVFMKLVKEYGDQTEVVEKVKPLLEELGNSDPAALMPPETIAYIEIGNPGQQVETIVNMLKGTPVEKTLAVLHQNSGQQGGGPVAMIRGLLTNPETLADLKKIRGIGVGIITELGQSNPPAVIVLYPGKSNTLRTMLPWILSGLGQRGESVEGMSVVKFGDGGAVAFDDTVVLAVSPSPKSEEILQQTIKRHKGKAGQPSLASANKSFTSVSKQARQQNALTLWVNVDETYGGLMKMLPPDQIPAQIQMANGFIDFQNVDDFIASLSLRETGVALDANLNFKDGSRSMFYNLIRTPNLKAEALKAIPADAVALITFTLGASDTAQAQVAGAKIKEATGLDLGPQIFGNIEQITLFAAPPKEAVPVGDSPLPAGAQMLGLAVTSKNPQQVHQLLTGLLTAHKLLPEGAEAPTLPATGRFDVTLANNMKFFGYTDQANQTMVLSLNSQVVDTSITALRQDSSIVRGGKLQEALATLPPATSKLVLLNVAGAIRVLSQCMEFPSDEAAAEARKSLEELAQAAEKTTVRLQTTEQDNSFGIRLSLSDLPPINQIIGPAERLAKMVGDAKASMTMAKTQAARAISIRQTSRAPQIDGKEDDVWAGAELNPIASVAYAPPSGEADLSAGFKTLYDSQALYLLVDVADDELINDSVEFWLDDTVEVFLDADNSKSDTYGENDYQYNFSWDSSAPNLGEARFNKTEGVQYAFARTAGGYRLEIKLPWSTLEVKPGPGTRIGLDVHVNDDDDGGDRDTKLMWHTKNDIAWQHPKALGTAELAGLVAWWKMDEKDGRTAADSSGNGHDATVQGNPDWQPAGGKLGGAIALGGDGDFLASADESAFDFTGGVTVAAWIKVTAFDKAWQPIVAKGDTAWRIQRNSETSTLEFACTGLKIPGDNQYGSLFGTKEISPGQWHHVAGVYDGKRMSLYIDGVLDSFQEAWGSINTNDLPVLIGENGTYNGRFWNGSIDDVRLYNYGLSEAQVKELSQGK